MDALSVIWASRDDDYAAGVNFRLIRSIESVMAAASKLRMELDLVVVDWNSPRDRKLTDFLRARHVSGVRVIEVPSRLCQLFETTSTKEFLEYPAKNVGIRRANTDHVLVINPDIVVSKQLLSACVSRPHLSDSFLRADRTDFSHGLWRRPKLLRRHIRHGINEGAPITVHRQGIMRRFPKTEALPDEEILEDLLIGPIGGSKSHFLLGMHTNASGDFLCTSKVNWLDAGGFDEKRWLIGMGDAVMVARLTSLGLRQAVYIGDSLLLHEDHPSDPTRGGTWSERSWPQLKQELTNIASQQKNVNDSNNFGLPDVDLVETRV